MIKKILVGIIYIAIYLILIFALILLFLTLKPINDSSAQAIGSIISLFKFSAIISVLLWVITAIVSLKKKEWLRKVILIVTIALFFLSSFQEYLTIRNVASMSLTEYTLINYLMELKIYYPLLWIIIIWLYLYKLGPVKEYFIEKENAIKKTKHSKE